MELTDLRKLQLLEVNLLQKFQEICESNHLTYYFVGGGLIGALRHGGFIPWDDDLDIVMPRNDYDKFVEICKKGIENGYAIDSNWNYVYSRFVDMNTTIEFSSAFNINRDNIWIDVFPVDGIAKGKLRRWLHMKHVLALRYLLVLTDTKHLAGKKKRPFYENIILVLFNVLPIFRLFSTKKVCVLLERSMRKYKYNNSDFCCNYVGKYREKEIQPRERWGKPTIILFEGVEVKVPELYHDFQTHIYGDYMKLPPECERIGHESKLIKYRNLDFDFLERQSKKSRIKTNDKTL